jgi:hypothetical protein
MTLFYTNTIPGKQQAVVGRLPEVWGGVVERDSFQVHSLYGPSLKSLTIKEKYFFITPDRNYN